MVTGRPDAADSVAVNVATSPASEMLALSTVRYATGQTVTWDQMMQSDFQFCEYLDDLDYDSPAPIKPNADGQFLVPVPGQWSEV